MLLPEVHITTETGEAGVTAWLHGSRSSWATVVSRRGSDPAAVAYQGGPHRLADETARTWEHWEQRGAPGLYHFGLTRTPGGQWIWSGDRDGPRWQPTETAAVR